MQYDALIFDLDGTLLNSLADIAASVNFALAEAGHPTHPVAAYSHFVGNGVHQLMLAALPTNKPELANQEHVALLVGAMRRYYADNLYTKTRPYPGIPEAIVALHHKGMPLAVLSNKMHAETVSIVEHFFPGGIFRYVEGAKEGVPLKPNPQSALQLAARMGFTPKRIAYIGDSDVDMLLAQKAGMHGIGAGWGFRGKQELMRAGAERCLDSPGELMDLGE